MQNLFSYNSQRTDQNWWKLVKTISRKLHFITRARFWTSSLSNIVDNFAEKIHKSKCKYEHDNQKCEICRTKQKDCECCLE